MNALIENTRLTLHNWRSRVQRGEVTVSAAQSSCLFQPKADQMVHDHPEIFLQIHGENHFTFPDGTYQLRKGDALLVPAGVPHQERAVDGSHPFRMLVIGLNRQQRSFIYGVKGHSPFPHVEQVFCMANPDAKAQQDHVSAMERYLITPTGNSTGVQLLGLLLESLAKQMELPATEDWTLTSQTLEEKASQLVIARFQEHGCNVASLARELGVSPNYLSAKYRAATGDKLSSYVLKERLEHAKRLLKETQMKVVDVAAASGFPEASPFIARFKARTGLTPLRYRESQQIPDG